MDDHIKSEIPAYLAGDLTESRQRQIEAHGASCEKCRSALNKARAKQARGKREALKKASTGTIPNLFLTRQGKEVAGHSSGLGMKGKVILLLVAMGGTYWAYQKWNTVPIAEVAPKPPVEPVSPPKETVPSTPSPVAEVPKVEPSKPPIVLPVLQSWKGSESAVRESRLLVIRRQDAWQKLWDEMQLVDAMPAIDFTDKIVLAVFVGPVAAGSAVDLGKIQEVGEEMVAPYRVATPAVQVSTLTAQTIPTTTSYPYLLAVVSRVDRKIKLTRRESL
jgi:hypothetical protein